MSHLKDHVKSVHEKPTEDESTSCEHCNKKFSLLSSLKVHIRKVHLVNPKNQANCELCPKVYKTLAELNRHKRYFHERERTHKCGQCEKAFFLNLN